MPGRIFQLNTSPGGVPKLAVREAMVSETGMDGDSHRFPEIHGGPERALCLFSLERILELQDEGHPIFPGAVGENVTISGLGWNTVVPGIRLMLGQDVVVGVVKYTSPCNSIPESFSDGQYERISQKVHPGWSRVYARVLRGGRLVVGQSVNVIDGRPFK
ncbi:MAG TPA: MOSC domain-containing protein [Pyrinomonadaceae bacterium]|nr:MOSC domain-containing protein [Pyrinomonadaceae bacterium]